MLFLRSQTNSQSLHDMTTTSEQTSARKTSTSATSPARNAKTARATKSKKKTSARAKRQKNAGGIKKSVKPNKTAITHCVQEELRRYFDMLDGEDPSNVYHLVMHQAEHALIDSVMRECGGNQSKATKWLGISRGTLRNKLADMGYD